MPIIFYCQHCFERVTTPNATAGKKGRCPFCGEMMDIPTIPDSTASNPTQPTAAAPQPNAAPTKKDRGDDPFESRERQQRTWGKKIQYGDDPTQPEIGKAFDERIHGTPAQRAAGARVRMPGACLLIASLAGIVAGIVVLLMVLIPAVGRAAESLSGTEIAIVAVAGVSCFVESLILVGVVDLIKVNNFRMAKTAAWAAVVPLSAWVPITLPFGIWALIVLSNRKTQEGFRVKPSKAQAYP